jgi:hypothetical protein
MFVLWRSNEDVVCMALVRRSLGCLRTWASKKAQSLRRDGHLVGGCPWAKSGPGMLEAASGQHTPALDECRDGGKGETTKRGNYPLRHHFIEYPLMEPP